ncbi:MAG: twin-arginine translocation signal domain-containing protein [Actinobacteria bacterium]|nr:twin-arginine translocation signal domain-containing protein [Actinomycetota bacterium]
MPTSLGELSRRNFMQAGLVAGAAMAVPWVVGAGYPTNSPAA